MRIIFSILLLSTFCFAANEKTKIIEQNKIEKAHEPQILELTKNIEVIADKKELKTSDQDALFLALKSICDLEPLDPSRDGAELLVESYAKNKKMYQDALKKFNAADQKTLKEIFKILEDLNKVGHA